MANRFLELKRRAKAPVPAGGISCRIAVLGDFATQHLSVAIRGVAAERGVGVELLDVDYDQIEQQTVDPSSELFEFHPDFVVVARCVERLHAEYASMEIEARAGLAERRYAEVAETWKRILSSSAATVLELNYAVVDDRIFGDYANSVIGSFLSQGRRLNTLLMEGAAQNPGVLIIDVEQIQARMGRETFSEPKLYLSSRIPFSLDGICEVASSVVSSVQARLGAIKKCIVCDLDNTLWGGVVSEDGVAGIQIGELGAGPAFTELQIWLKLLRERGVLLAVCSKNDDSIAREPFERNPEMVLSLDDFAMFVANWEDKASNIRVIQQTLNIGMDSIVFIDDNPFERNLVREMLPEVTVPELPDDPSLYLPFLQELNLFATAAYSREDANRTSQYIAEGRRRESESSFADYGEYLDSLDMVAGCLPFDDFHAPRIAQLTQRSNQFNLRTVRYGEDEVRALSTDPDAITRYFTLRDRFGDSGLVSVVILRHRGEKSLFIDSWLMSCRVLKRGLEDFVMNEIVSAAREAGAERVIGEYRPTLKNAMVKPLYEKMGFSRVGKDVDSELWELEVDKYSERATYIERG